MLFEPLSGRGGIRTLECLSALPVFKTGAIDHSATLPNPYFSGVLSSFFEGLFFPYRRYTDLGNTKFPPVVVTRRRRTPPYSLARLVTHVTVYRFAAYP
jgi:hypothetical protein